MSMYDENEEIELFSVNYATDLTSEINPVEGEEIELFSVDYTSEPTSSSNHGDLSDIVPFRAVALCEQPGPFPSWSAENLFESQLSFTASKEAGAIHVKSSSDRGVSSSLLEPPFGLPKASQFTIARGNEDLVQQIDSFLKNSEKMNEFDFSFQSSDKTWKGKCLSGAYCLEVDIRLYFKHASDEYVVAVLKMRGSEPRGVSFMDFFFNLREYLTGERPTKRRKLNLAAIQLPSQGLLAPTRDEFLEGAAPIVAMVSDECFDVRLEAAKMICDLSTKSTVYLEVKEFRQTCITILQALVQDAFEEVRQHAVMALAGFVELVSYQDAILETETMLLPVLFSAIDNAANHESESWQTAKVRRTAASIVSVLCARNAALVVDQLQRLYDINVDKWAAELVPRLLDTQTKLHAETIARSFQEPSPSSLKSTFQSINHGVVASAV